MKVFEPVEAWINWISLHPETWGLAEYGRTEFSLLSRHCMSERMTDRAFLTQEIYWSQFAGKNYALLVQGFSINKQVCAAPSLFENITTFSRFKQPVDF